MILGSEEKRWALSSSKNCSYQWWSWIWKFHGWNRYFIRMQRQTCCWYVSSLLLWQQAMGMFLFHDTVSYMLPISPSACQLNKIILMNMLFEIRLNCINMCGIKLLHETFYSGKNCSLAFKNRNHRWSHSKRSLIIDWHDQLLAS